eukprot:m.48962 g.48962  ORF g.48962 m.48962 type:complete len:89 (+) comp20901_c0_seq1:38-304(+)
MEGELRLMVASFEKKARKNKCQACAAARATDTTCNRITDVTQLRGEYHLCGNIEATERAPHMEQEPKTHTSHAMRGTTHGRVCQKHTS